MHDPSPLAPLISALADVVALLTSQNVQGVVIGGVASSLLGRARATRDIDAVLWLDEKDWAAFLDAATRGAFRPRISDPLEFARRSRVLLLRHEASGIDIDLALGALPFDLEAIQRATARDLAGIRVPLPTPEDLVVMKAVAHRPRDDADIEGLLQANPKLDLRRVRRLLKDFSTALDQPEIAADFDRLVKRARRR